MSEGERPACHGEAWQGINAHWLIYAEWSFDAVTYSTRTNPNMLQTRLLDQKCSPQIPILKKKSPSYCSSLPAHNLF